VLSWRDLQAYEGNRATRGHSLPRGFQRVDSVESV
jgi:topoisomerase IV subunit A